VKAPSSRERGWTLSADMHREARLALGEGFFPKTKGKENPQATGPLARHHCLCLLAADAAACHLHHRCRTTPPKTKRDIERERES
jgi:hypothetical protein